MLGVTARVGAARGDLERAGPRIPEPRQRAERGHEAHHRRQCQSRQRVRRRCDIRGLLPPRRRETYRDHGGDARHRGCPCEEALRTEQRRGDRHQRAEKDRDDNRRQQLRACCATDGDGARPRARTTGCSRPPPDTATCASVSVTVAATRREPGCNHPRNQRMQIRAHVERRAPRRSRRNAAPSTTADGDQRQGEARAPCRAGHCGHEQLELRAAPASRPRRDSSAAPVARPSTSANVAATSDPVAHHVDDEMPAPTPARCSACQSMSTRPMESAVNASALAGRRRRSARARPVNTPVTAPSNAARPPSPRCDHATAVNVSADAASSAAPTHRSTDRTRSTVHSAAPAERRGRGRDAHRRRDSRHERPPELRELRLQRPALAS